MRRYGWYSKFLFELTEKKQQAGVTPALAQPFDRADFQLLKQTTKDLKRLKLEFYAEELYVVTLKTALMCYWQDPRSCQCTAPLLCRHAATDESPRPSRSDAD